MGSTFPRWMASKTWRMARASPCALRIVDWAWPSALRIADCFSPSAVRPAVALGLHLLLHCALDGARRIDGLQFDARHANAPASGRLVKLAAQLAVDLIAPRESLLHVHRSDDVSKRRDRKLLNGGHRVGDLIGRGDRVRHLVVDDGVDGDVDVVRGDDRLRREGNDLLAHVDPLPNGIDEREQEVQTRRKGLVIPAQALDDVGVPLVDHLDRHENEKDHDECNQGQKYESDVYIVHNGSF